MAVSAAEAGLLRGYGLDLHAHVPGPNAQPRKDGWKNTPEAIIPKIERLLGSGRINAIGLARHDGFPQEELDEVGRAFPETETLGASEVTAYVPSRRRIGNFVHFLAFFPGAPRDWPFPQHLDWPERLRDRISFIRNLPKAKEVLAAIQDQGGLTAVAHPVPDWYPVPWSSLSVGEIVDMVNNKLLPRDVAIELNGCNVHRPVYGFIKRFAERYRFPVVGGSDAHKPDNIGRQTTRFPQRGTLWQSFKNALANRETSVVRGPLVRT